MRLRQILATNKLFAERLAAIEKKYDQRFKVVFDILRQLMEPHLKAAEASDGVRAPEEKENILAEKR